MNISNLIDLYFERSTALQWYWTIYVIIIGGLLAFSSLRKQWDPLSTALVTVLYCFFAFKNLGAIQDVSAQRNALLDLVKEYPQATGADPTIEERARSVLEPTLIASDLDHVRNFHAASDVLTVAALWAMELRRRRNRE